MSSRVEKTGLTSHRCNENYPHEGWRKGQWPSLSPVCDHRHLCLYRRGILPHWFHKPSLDLAASCVTPGTLTIGLPYTLGTFWSKAFNSLSALSVSMSAAVDNVKPSKNGL